MDFALDGAAPGAAGRGQYDPDGHFDSSSSSGEGSGASEDHSSPADSSYSAASNHAWGLDLDALAAVHVQVPWGAAHSPLDPAAFAAASAASLKLAPRHSSRASSAAPEPHHAQPDGCLPLPSDFWTASDAHRESPSAASLADDDHRSRANASGGDYFSAPGDSQERGQDRMEMEFDDMVHGDVCGPATLTSPTETLSTPLSAPSSAYPTSASTTAFSAQLPLHHHHNHHHQQSVGIEPLSIPVNLLAVNAGIAPSLTSSTHTPSPAGSPASEFPSYAPIAGSVDVDFDSSAPSTRASSVSRVGRSTRTSMSGPGTAPGTRDASLSRRSEASTSSSATAPTASAAASSGPGAGSQRTLRAETLNSAGKSIYTASGSVNLVARDAVQAARLIPSFASPSPADLRRAAAQRGLALPAEMLVLGVPTVGAKSRVETQIKVSLALVRPRDGAKVETDAHGRVGDALVLEEGGLDASAANVLERVGTWTHLRLPKFLALKSKPGKTLGAAAAAKAAKPEPPADKTLLVDVAVVSATDPAYEITICTNCEQRELKRSLRKKDAKGKVTHLPIPVPAEGDGERNEAEERRKVVVFNATEFVEFQTGEVIIPTRITCYCRHHKEKKGFCIRYRLRDHQGNLVATGLTPPIMITDDHKTTSSTKAASTAAAAAAEELAAQQLLQQQQQAGNAKRKAGKAGNAASSTRRDPKRDKSSSPGATSVGSASAPTTHASGRPRRQPTARSRRGATESDDEGYDAAAAGKKNRPYDADARPARSGTGKRAGGSSASSTHRSPTFAMTPLRAGSPVAPTPSLVGNVVLPPLPGRDGQTGSPSITLGSALGLGGLEDAFMAESTPQNASGMVTPATSYMSSDEPRRSLSIDPLQTQQQPLQQVNGALDWRGSLSSPPLSPGSTAPSESLQSFFSGFPSPNPSLLECAPVSTGPPPPQIPSFAIPATEPIPTSLTPSWALNQQPEQLTPPAVAPPRISRIIPAEGPVHGGVEVTVLGENFVRDLTCVFGDSAAVPTHFWSANTLVCVLPPSPNPGPVVVSIKGVPLTVEPGMGGLQLFTYRDDSDRSLLELALQVVGLKMMGRVEDASAIAMRIVGNSQNGGAGATATGAAGGAAPGGASDTAALAATLNAAATSVYATPASSRASSRRSSVSGPPSPGSSSLPPLPAVASGETRNFEGIVIKFLSLLDLDPSLIPGAAPSLPSTRPPISFANAQQHTLLHLAAVLGFHRLVAFLLQRDIALDAADRNGYTALHFAALYGRVNIARQLLDAGATLGARNMAGKTPLEIAQERDDVDVEDLLLARGAAGMATPRISASARRQLVSFSPRQQAPARSLLPSPSASPRGGRRLSLPSSRYASEDEEDRATEYPSDWTVESDSEDESDDDHAHDADESEDYDSTSPVRRPIRSRNVSRSGSTISLHHLVETEEEEIVEAKRVSPRFRRVSLTPPDSDDDKPVAPPQSLPITPLNQLASVSSSWLSQKLKPTVQPGLDKLQPLAGGVTGVWEKAKATRFGVPQMHIPEITAFHAMPAALTRHMSGASGSAAKSKRRRAATVGEARELESHDATDLGEQADESSAERLTLSPLRDWRAAFPTPHWWHKAPSSPPPSYSATEDLASPPPEKPAATSATSSVSLAASSASLARRVVAAPRDKLRRRISAASQESDETDAGAETDTGSTYSAVAEGQVGIRQDTMLRLFWLPVLLVALYFAYTRWSTQVQPVIDTFVDTVFPHAVGFFRR